MRRRPAGSCWTVFTSLWFRCRLRILPPKRSGRPCLRSLNDLYDARRGRFHSAFVSLPPVLWWNLLAGAALLLAFSYLFGPPNLWMHAAIVSLLGAAIGLVLILILQLTHPFEGDNHISAAAFNALIRDVESASYPHR